MLGKLSQFIVNPGFIYPKNLTTDDGHWIQQQWYVETMDYGLGKELNVKDYRLNTINYKKLKIKIKWNEQNYKQKFNVHRNTT